MGLLSHPNIIKLYANGWKNNNIHQLCMEYMNCGNLRKYLMERELLDLIYLRERDRLEENEFSNIVLQILEGCRYLEENFIIHRLLLKVFNHLKF